MSKQLDFSDAQLLATLSAADQATLDSLELGVVKMSKDGAVLAVNEAEVELSGLSHDAFIGRNFFTQVAPCTNNYMVAEKYRQLDELDESISYVFTYMMKPTPVRLRMLKSSAYDAQFLVVDRNQV